MTQVTGSFTAPGQTLVIQPSGQVNINVHWTGTFTGLSMNFEGSVDAVQWSQVYCQQSNTAASNYNTPQFDSTITPHPIWSLLKSSYEYFRVRCMTISSGQADLTLETTGTGSLVVPPSPSSGGTDTVDAVQIQGETQLSFAIGTSGAQASSGVASAGVYDFSCDVDCFLKIAPAAGTASNVTTATGEPLFAGNVVPHRLSANDRPGAITSAGSGTLRYIRVHA